MKKQFLCQYENVMDYIGLRPLKAGAHRGLQKNPTPTGRENFPGGDPTDGSGHKPSFYNNSFDRPLCDAWQTVASAPGQAHFGEGISA
jgi:hypothetical protein